MEPWWGNMSPSPRSVKTEKKVRNNVWKRKKVVWKSWKRKWKIMSDFLFLNY